jgi:hypothetical protein
MELPDAVQQVKFDKFINFSTITYSHSYVEKAILPLPCLSFWRDERYISAL